MEENKILDTEDTETGSSDNSKLDVENSILLSVKKMIGIVPEDIAFDTDILIHINSVFGTLHQLGVGPKDVYRISNSDNKWEEFIKDSSKIDSVKTYIYLKVKLLFDPPSNSFIVSSFNEQIRELEWRLNVASESK